LTGDIHRLKIHNRLPFERDYYDRKRLITKSGLNICNH